MRFPETLPSFKLSYDYLGLSLSLSIYIYMYIYTHNYIRTCVSIYTNLDTGRGLFMLPQRST